MLTSEMTADFDQQINLARTTLEDSAREYPEAITETRRAQLEHALGRLYLPNVNPDGIIKVVAAESPEDKVAFLPREVAHRVKGMEVALPKGETTYNRTGDFVKKGALGLFSYRIAAGVFGNKTRYLEYCILEGDGYSREDGHGLLHEVTHHNQSYRAPSTEPEPKELAPKPIARRADLALKMQMEAETYWQQQYMFNPDKTAAIYEEIQDFRRRIADDWDLSIPYLMNLKPTSLVVGLIQEGLLHADKAPDKLARALLLNGGIVKQ